MAEYYLDEKGQIYGDLAFRLGNIIKQYGNHIDKNDPYNFDSSLCICILQNLLTIYDEMFPIWNGYPMTRGSIFYNPQALLSKENYFALNNEMVLKNSFLMEDQIVGSFMKHIRNSLSHPTKLKQSQEIQSTGYYSVSNSSKFIEGYIFIDSPDVDNNSPKSFSNNLKFLNYCKKNRGYGFEKKIVDSRIFISNPRIYKVQLSTDELKDLTLKMAKFIAQPIQKNWDGLIFNEKILDAA